MALSTQGLLPEYVKSPRMKPWAQPARRKIWSVEMWFVFNLFVLHLREGVGFRCFSEYEFTWWDSAGLKHINAISMSHFQLKANAALRYGTSNRIPLKEAFFLARLHPTYRENLVNDCPHALITAHLIIALFSAQTDPNEFMFEHHRLALKIFNETARIHQEVTYHAWPLVETLELFQATIGSRLGATSNIPRNVSFVVLVPALDAVTEAVIRNHIVNFHHSRLFVRDIEPFGSISSSFNETALIHSDLSDCSLRTSMLGLIPSDSFPVVFISSQVDLVPGLLEQFLKYLIHTREEIPSFFSFGLRRGMPFVMNGSLVISGSYSGSNFAIGSAAKISPHLPVVKQICSETKSDAVWDQVFRKDTVSLHMPLRCDDGNLPISLRLCLGNEHMRTDWRNTVLAPVVPRHPVNT